MYQKLFNSCDTSEGVESIKDKLKDLIGRDLSVNDADLITGSVLKDAACRMKPGKGDVSGSYTSDAILNAPDSFFNIMAPVFRSWLVHGTVTLSLLACAFLPLFKGGLKDPSKTDSYRAIAGASLLLKLFDNVVLLLWGDRLSSDSLQFGFKKNTSTTQCSWLVMETAGYFLRRGSPCIVTLMDCSKAFDMCSFEVLFKKLMEKGLPPLVVRTLVFIYQEQTAWVRWGGAKSSQFGITNGTRQGSVLSPCFFAVYMDELLQKLRDQGLGCHIGEVFYGAAGFADDLILISPSRTGMQRMLEVCEQYALENNLIFSTDENPEKSKTKCLFMCGKVGAVQYPAPLRLNDRDLPWVVKGTHLGHELHQSCNMNFDAKCKRAAFIDKSTDIRHMFSFAVPYQMLSAVNVYAAHFYGSMLWDLSSEAAWQVYRSWNTCVKLAWDIPRWTHNYLVDGLLAGDIPPVRQKILCQYVNFFGKLTSSPLREVRLLAKVVGKDMGSVTGQNLAHLREEFQLDPWTQSVGEFKKEYTGYMVPEVDRWRLPLLQRLLEQRREMEACGEEVEEMTSLIDSLCSS